MRKDASSPTLSDEQPALLSPDGRSSTQDVAADDLDLESLFEHQCAWPELAEHLLAKADEAGVAEERSIYLDKATIVFETRLHDLEGAFLSCVEAVKSSAGLDRIAVLQRLASTLSRSDTLAQTYAAAAACASTPSSAATAWTALAGWQRCRNAWEACANAAQNALACLPSHVAALSELESAERHLERWGDLARTLTRKISLEEQRGFARIAPGHEHTQLALALSAKWQDLGRLDEASRVIEAALKTAPTAEALFEELAQLYGARGCWHQFIENCWQHASVTQDGHVRARLAFEAGRVLQNRLARTDAAQAAYTEALTHEPQHLNARRGLVGVYRTRGDVESLSEALWELADLSDDREEKVACFTEAAAILRDTLRDVDRARSIEIRLQSIDPGNAAAFERRLDDAAEAQEWNEVLDLFATAATTTRPGGHAVARAAEARFRLGNTSEALAGFAYADALAAPGISWRVVWVTALTQSQQHHQQAATLARQLLADPSLSGSQRCELNTCVAHACLALGNPTAASNALKAALSAVPDHLPAVAAMSLAHRAAGRLADAVAWKWTAFDRSSNEADKVSHALEIFSWVRDEAQDLLAARTVIVHALEHFPTSPALLHALLKLHTQHKEWQQVVPVLRRLASVSHGQHRAQYLVAAADVLSINCAQMPKAAAMFEAALDAAQNDAKLALRVERFYLENNDVIGYERHLRRHLSRISTEQASLVKETQIWEKLVRLYQGPMPNPSSAAVALEVLATLKQSPASYEKLAAAYEQVGTPAIPRAVQIYVQLASHSNDVPTLAESLRALQRIFARTGDLGRSLNVSTGLVLLGQATATEHELVTEAAGAPFVPPIASLRSSAWTKHIYHPSLRREVSAVLAYVSPAVAAAHARTAKEWGLTQKWDHGPSVELESHTFVLRLRHLASSIGVDLPPMAFQKNFDGIADLVAVNAGNTVKLALVLGNAFFEPRTEASFAFVMARLLTRLRPEFIVTWPNICSSEGELRTVVAAACQLVGHEIALPADYTEFVQRYVQLFKQHLSPETLESLASASTSIPYQDELVSAWLNGISLTANRAGLLMCRNLVSAVAEATTDRLFGIGLGQFEATRDLLAWSSTSEYALFERHLGSPE